MAKRMLIDATQAEETRVTVIDGNRLDELDFEVASRQQLKGNIYLAKVTRVEPSLQAAFVEYGGNRHGFLAFAEIHPDYYKIPVADREKLLEMERQLQLEEEREEEEAAARAAARAKAQAEQPDVPLTDLEAAVDLTLGDVDATAPATASSSGFVVTDVTAPAAPLEPAPVSTPAAAEAMAPLDSVSALPASSCDVDAGVPAPLSEDGTEITSAEKAETAAEGEPDAENEVEGEDDIQQRRANRRRMAVLRQYKIQEVIKRNQILLIQVVKEERGNKGAALTTYLSLAGRYCVLMPNTNRGGGVSRKISSIEERRRMKALLAELDLPEGMSIILRTAGLERSKADIKRDLEYLTRLWDSIRDKTLSSTAPSLIHEEANLIRRAIRDLYSRDVTEIQVEGDNGYHTAKEFMRMMVPSAARRVHHYRDPAVPLFVRYRVESQIETLYSSTVSLRSGGYIVIDQTEALVAIDVNSGRSTRERNIEETALRTNLEAADEVARQLRLRDMAGLVVIDFIDMEDARHNAQVERRLREAMKMDRARIQMGRISMFGLMELSRQRLRPSLIETNFSTCPHCGGTGHTRSTESAALHVLRAIEEEGLQQKASELAVTVSEDVALYLLNTKRAALSDIERRYGIKVFVHSNAELRTADHKIEKLKARLPGEFKFPEPPPPIIEDDPPLSEEDLAEDEELDDDDKTSSGDSDEGDITETGGEPRDPRRRRRGGGRNRNDRWGRKSGRGESDVSQPGAPQPDIPEGAAMVGAEADMMPAGRVGGDINADSGYVPMTGHAAAGEPVIDPATGLPVAGPAGETEGERSDRMRRRRGRRGGRGRYRGEQTAGSPESLEGAEQPSLDGVAPDATGAVPSPSGAPRSNRRPPRGPRPEREPRTEREPRQEREPRAEGAADGERPARQERAPRPERGPRPERSDRGDRQRPQRYTPPSGAPAASGEAGGVRIVSEFRGRNDPAPQQRAPAPAPQQPSVSAPVAAPTPPAPPPAEGGERRRTGWWKRLIGSE